MVSWENLLTGRGLGRLWVGPWPGIEVAWSGPQGPHRVGTLEPGDMAVAWVPPGGCSEAGCCQAEGRGSLPPVASPQLPLYRWGLVTLDLSPPYVSLGETKGGLDGGGLLPEQK